MSNLHKRLDRLQGGEVDWSRAWINVNGHQPPPPDWRGKVLEFHTGVPRSPSCPTEDA